MRSRTLCALVLIAACALPAGAQNPTLQTAMRQKLANAQELLEALVRGNFDQIDRSAEALSRITDTEIASWQAVARPDYTEMASVFLLAVQGLRDAAEDRDLDAALTEYTTMISACTRCHTSVRDAGNAD